MTEQHRDPSEVSSRRGWFDEFAARAHDIASRDIFFLCLVVLTLLWAPTYFLLHDVTYWYIAFILPAEVVTLFLVALLENNSRRSEQALHRKLDAFAEALASRRARRSASTPRSCWPLSVCRTARAPTTTTISWRQRRQPGLAAARGPSA